MDAGSCSIPRRTCSVTESGLGCILPAEDSPLDLCARHHLAAYEWVAREVGVTDVLPSACVACGSRLGVRYPSGWLCAICEWRVGEIPDPDSDVARVDVVYYLRFGDRIKIGTSANPRQRLTAIRHDEVLAFERGARELEQQRHAQFGSHRLGTSEWFEDHPALRRHVAVLGAGVLDPWSQFRLWTSQQWALRG